METFSCYQCLGRRRQEGTWQLLPKPWHSLGVLVQREARSPQLTPFLYPPRNNRSSKTSITSCRAGGKNLGWGSPTSQTGAAGCLTSHSSPCH